MDEWDLIEGLTLEELDEQGRDVSALVLHLLDHLPPGELVPADCEFYERRRGWFVLVPTGDMYAHEPGSARRSRVLPSGHHEITRFVKGRVVERVVRPPRVEPDR